MNEILQLCAALEHAATERRPTWLATVIGVEGSAYRRPGARMLFDREAVLAGGVSAGCLEADLVKRGAWLTRRGPSIKTYEASFEDDMPGHGCSGTVSILVAATTPAIERCFAQLAEALAAEQQVALVTVISSSDPELAAASHFFCPKREHQVPRQLVAASGNPRARELLSQARCVLREGQHRAHNLRCDGVEALVQVIEPSPHLFIFGAGSDAVPVVDLAKLLGWKVSVCTRSNRPTIRDRFAGKARLLELPGADAVALAETCARPLALVMAHDYETDRENLDALLATSIPYIGVLGPAERTDRMVAELRLRGRYLSDADLERVHGPAGLRLGAETPSEIALSILSEAQALIARTQVVALRDCVESIHAPPMQRLRATYAERS